MRELIGVSAALATPFDEGGGIDWPQFCAHSSRLLSSGMNVVTAFGTTGEGVSIARLERDALHDQMAQAGVAASQLIECIYGPSSVEAGQQVRRSLGNGGAGILLTPPFYFKAPSEEGIYRWYAEAFEAAGAACRNIMLYNIPPLTGVAIGPALVGRLRQTFPEIVAGVKDSSGDWTQTAALLAEHRDIAILVGHEGHLAQAVRQGASGTISGIANVAPTLIAKLVAGEHDTQIDISLDRLLAMPVVSAIKGIIAAQSGDDAWRRVRAPLLPIETAGDLATCAALATDLA